jgi:DNA-binding transcriptional regulator YhcF (GntR family)
MYKVRQYEASHIFFRFACSLIREMKWALLSTAAKAVFPVIASHCDQSGRAIPSEETIAMLSGRSPKTVRRGIRDLRGFSGFRRMFYRTKYGRRGLAYIIEFPSRNEGMRYFFFHRELIDSGIWGRLKPGAQALYPVMRFFSYWNSYLEEGFEPYNFKEDYANRTYEICQAEINALAEHAGIDRHTVNSAIENLRENHLIEDVEEDDGIRKWKIFIIPSVYYHQNMFKPTKKILRGVK